MPRRISEARLNDDYEQIMLTHAKIQELVEAGILSRELCPMPNYWHWDILQPDKLPDEFKFWIPYGEVRWLCQRKLNTATSPGGRQKAL